MHHPLLVLRTAGSPAPAPTGDLMTDLRARRAHALDVRWLPAADVDARTDLHRWLDGSGPSGPRLGLCFLDGGGAVFLPHPAPGEISPTTGLLGDTLTPWLQGLGRLCEGRAATVRLDGERFELEAEGTVRALDPDGIEEGRIRLDPEALSRQLATQLAPLTALLEAAEAAGRSAPVRPEDARRALRGLQHG